MNKIIQYFKQNLLTIIFLELFGVFFSLFGFYIIYIQFLKGVKTTVFGWYLPLNKIWDIYYLGLSIGMLITIVVFRIVKGCKDIDEDLEVIEE